MIHLVSLFASEEMKEMIACYYVFSIIRNLRTFDGEICIHNVVEMRKPKDYCTYLRNYSWRESVNKCLVYILKGNSTDTSQIPSVFQDIIWINKYSLAMLLPEIRQRLSIYQMPKGQPLHKRTVHSNQLQGPERDFPSILPSQPLIHERASAKKRSTNGK